MGNRIRRNKTKSPGKFRQAAGKTLRGVSFAVLIALLGAVFGLVVIMTGPKRGDSAPVVQPLSSPAPAVTIQSFDSLPDVMRAFPADMLVMLPREEVTVRSATCYDVPFEGGVARVADVSYTLDDGGTLTLTSIYPARASSLIERDGYALIGSTELAGLPAIRMSRADSVRIHAQHPEAAYVMTAPNLPLGTLSMLVQEVRCMSHAEE